MELAQMIAEVTGYKGTTSTDLTKPDDLMRKLMNVDRFGRMGWGARIGLRDSIEHAHRWFLVGRDAARA